MKLYKAVVEDNLDPEKLARVRVRVYGLHTAAVDGFSSVKTEDLPWAQVVGGNQFGLVGGNGISSILRQGTWVWVVLEEDNPNKPIVIGTIIGNVTQQFGESFADPDEVHPKTTGSDVHSLVQDKYPTLATLETESGHLIELDDTPGDQRIKITHTTGSYFLIDNDGNIFVNGVANIQYDIAGNATWNIQGNQTTNVQGETTHATAGDTTVTASNIYLN